MYFNDQKQNRTAIRVRSAVLSMVFWKIGRMRSLKDKSVGEVCQVFKIPIMFKTFLNRIESKIMFYFNQFAKYGEIEIMILKE